MQIDKKNIILIVGLITLFSLFIIDFSGTLEIGNIIISTDLYEDLRFPVQSFRVQGSTNVPDFLMFKGNTYIYAFDDSTMEQVFLTMQLPHSRKDDSMILPHFHFSNKDSLNNGTVRFCNEITCSNVYGVFSDNVNLCVNTYIAPTQEYTHYMSDMIHIENSLKASAICTIRVYRDAANVEDTFPDDIYLLEYDIHYIIDKLGEVSEY
jgi:hypothetical protein